jgi:hypothetical protein
VDWNEWRDLEADEKEALKQAVLSGSGDQPFAEKLVNRLNSRFS